MTEKQKIYSELFNDLLMLIVTGVSVGASVFMCIDYLSGSVYVERALWMVIVSLLVSILCVVYWIYKLFKEKNIKSLFVLRTIVAAFALLGMTASWYSTVRNAINASTVYLGKKLAVEDKMKTINILWQRLDTLQHMAGYYLTYVAEETYYTTMTNTRGESLTQAPDNSAAVSVCLTNGAMVSFTENHVSKTRNLDNIGIIKHALDFAAEKKAELEWYAVEEGVEARPDEAAYVVKISGIQRIREFYSSFMVTSEVEKILAELPANSAPTLLFGLFVSADGTALTCSIEQYGDGALMWYVEGSSPLYDWSLSGDWYNFDFTEAEKAEQYLTATLTSVSNMLDNYRSAMGIFDGIGDLTEDTEN